MKRVLFFLMLAPACGFGQAGAKAATAPKKAAAAPARWPIESITIEGTRNFTREQVLALAGLKVGQIAGKAEFDAARDRLAGCGAFETVSYRFTPGPNGGYAAVIQLNEVQQVYPVEFEDLHVSLRELTAVLEAKDPLFTGGKLPATHPVMARYEKWLQEFLASKGMDEKIAGNVRPAQPGEYAIVFHPVRNLPAVAQITFEGNNVIPQNTLREAIAVSGIGAPYTEDTFRQILNLSIRPLYEMRGRVRVAFPEIRTEPVKDVAGLHVFVKVDEGQSYELGKVTIEGPTPLAPETLLKAGDFKSGDVANIERVNEGLEKIRKLVRRSGYLEAKVTSERKIDDPNKKVELAVHVESGPQFTMGKLTITGLDLNAEAEMRRIWGLKDGKPFNPDYPEQFLNRVKEQAMFDNLGQTKADFQVNNRDHTADVTLSFKGSQPQPKRRPNQ
jgi:outer membrane protein insertion porin family